MTTTKQETIDGKDRRTLEFLRFAMAKHGVDPRLWQAGLNYDALPHADDTFCLFRDDRQWVVGYTEHGAWQETGRFPACYHAAKYLFSQFVGPSPYDYRDEWEAETGQKLMGDL
jgi:hypothetical protein